ncbi:MAG: ATP-binding protein [Lentisphaeria bacterium]|nr:ATP-binding protein [Lentisphaeria bacterium]
MKPWRQIARPHKDVLEGTFKQSEFAADISQVARGIATPEYQDAEKFYARTYITEGMRLLLISVAQRLAGKAGDPVIQLQTNFGGGKTHTLLAVYHLASRKVSTDKLPGIPSLLDEAGITHLPTARIAVIDGTNLSPNQPMERGALKIKTIWGQIAYQLLGAEGYDMVKDSDDSGSAPGKEVMIDLLKKASPCVLLLDELVAFYRQLDGSARLSAGTFESNMSFIQSLTESVKAVPNAILLASLPESNTEAVGSFGQRVLDTLEKYFGRVESVWKPVASDESFEIVRRRLFDSMGDQAELENVCQEFVDYYRKNKDKLPPEIQEGSYAERLKKSYPIHPEIFDRLYQDWSTLDKFQKTRGVLQYMAIIIHRLWNSNDQDPMIMPGSIPLEDTNVRIKSVHYLPQGWDPIIDKEIDGDSSEPARIDGNDTRFGSIFAARRAARTIFLGSAPSSSAQGHRGIAMGRILLGSAIPDQSLSVYEDVLKRLRDKLHYLFADVDRFWFDTRPNLRREMESRKAKIDLTLLNKTLKDSTSKLVGHGNLFAGVHVFTSHADIPDEIGNGPRLVVLPPEIGNAYSSADKRLAFGAAESILERRGEQPRLRRNRLFFLAPDLNNIGRVLEQCRIYLAWKEIVADIEAMRLNLDTFQINQAKKECDAASTILEQTLLECYRFLMIPEQNGPSKVGFEVRRIGTTNSNIASAVEKVLTEGEYIIQRWSPVFLKKHLADNYFKNGQTEVSVLKVWQDCCTYYQMPRLLNEDVFDRSMTDGVTKGDYFGFADGKEGEKYLGFKYGEQVFTLEIDDSALLIECDAAANYKAAHAQPVPVPVQPGDPASGGSAVIPETGGNGGATPAAGGSTVQPGGQPKKQYKRFFGTIELDPVTGALQLQNVMQELVSLFTTKPGIEVSLKLDIEASSQTPFDDNTIRAAKENSVVLKLESFDFTED